METVSARLDIGTLQLFENILKEKRSAIVRELVESGKKHKAVELYKMRKVSLGLGARLAEVTISEFIDLLRESNVSLNIEKDDVRQALETIRKTL